VLKNCWKYPKRYDILVLLFYLVNGYISYPGNAYYRFRGMRRILK